MTRHTQIGNAIQLYPSNLSDMQDHPLSIPQKQKEPSYLCNSGKLFIPCPSQNKVFFNLSKTKQLFKIVDYKRFI